MRENKKSLLLILTLYGLAILIGLGQLFCKPKNGARDFQFLSFFSKIKEPQPVIAIVPLYGVISISNDSWHSKNSADQVVKKLKKLSEDKDVKAVVLRINSPGGSVGAVQEIYDEVWRLKRSGKKVIASMGEVAASGGYYIASAADKIMADPGTITGSIGVIFKIGNLQELFKKIGVRVETIQSKEHKDIGSPFRQMTEKEREIIRSIINDAYNQFIEAILKGRKMEKAKLLELADGRIFSGAQAKDAGLIDELGNLEAAILKAGEISGLKEKPKILREEDPFEKFFSILKSENKGKIWEEPLNKFGIRFAYLWDYN
ncbi:MAG: hypothetical protein A3I11_03350 [Elusimicrobia bacterium RIFCSPLOWO2_02_FULL_39_32]|nr:MAG: hypothetical protein A3B80_01920 [Elusimicrobia bacterium RIFCSPHIGHO2_02_FULL_39_36]OGR92744.1 MAG: hypothetical protein A3I11_03350 [Elusimicrobia bacterium RIFCSPLOWO2_02_FULL_39_32]OGR99529.1 MAG: hypothetical protein A3G85_00705 [Elusimicrobia bacterium RIFCSPLOWO2_12_FULL_39_28]